MTHSERENLAELPYTLSDIMEQRLEYLLWRHDIELPKRLLEEIRNEIYFTSKDLIDQL